MRRAEGERHLVMGLVPMVPLHNIWPLGRAGSQVGSHSSWIAVNGCGRPWTPLGDLRIRRLWAQVLPSALAQSLVLVVGRQREVRDCQRATALASGARRAPHLRLRSMDKVRGDDKHFPFSYFPRH